MFRILALLLTLVSALPAAVHDFDVVVYGGTAGGVIAAVTAAREGVKTALLEPTAHIGGMVSGGLSWTDYGKKEVIGGYALEFYRRVGAWYELGRHAHRAGWIAEPHVAEQIFRDMLRETGVTLFERRRLKEKEGVRKSGVTVAEIFTEDGDSFRAGVFLDSSYEGDLMAQAGVSWTWGRESSAQYGESLGGVREKTPYHQFLVNIPAEGPAAKLQPPGSADRAVQAYNYRMCFSEVPSNQVAFQKPDGYDPRRYELLARLIEARTKEEGKTPALGSLIKIDRIPGGKADINNNGAFSTDYIGGSWRYPLAGYAERARIWQEHKGYQAGLFYFLSNDPQLPEPLRREMNRWGLCKDEFTDTGSWPNQLYIRESRRMVGEYVVVQKDLQTDRTKPDPIGMGSYNSDSHNVQRIVDVDGFVRNEGDMQVAVQPYQIPYRVMLPKRAEATNLLVPVAFSASHVAYSSLRMEPQYMILGQAAGVAAAMAFRGGKAVQAIDGSALGAALLKQGAVFEYRAGMIPD
ncbi:MAG: FAD-dependent oxidoreductase [Acidobacteriia bacterium]|nr:FAD-dependent oxidoreductase [Terriglobia bacterium]